DCQGCCGTHDPSLHLHSYGNGWRGGGTPELSSFPAAPDESSQRFTGTDDWPAASMDPDDLTRLLRDFDVQVPPEFGAPLLEQIIEVTEFKTAVNRHRNEPGNG